MILKYRPDITVMVDWTLIPVIQLTKQTNQPNPNQSQTSKQRTGGGKNGMALYKTSTVVKHMQTHTGQNIKNETLYWGQNIQIILHGT